MASVVSSLKMICSESRHQLRRPVSNYLKFLSLSPRFRQGEGIWQEIGTSLYDGEVDRRRGIFGQTGPMAVCDGTMSWDAMTNSRISLPQRSVPSSKANG